MANSTEVPSSALSATLNNNPKIEQIERFALKSSRNYLAARLEFPDRTQSAAVRADRPEASSNFANLALIFFVRLLVGIKNMLLNFLYSTSFDCVSRHCVLFADRSASLPDGSFERFSL